MFKRAVILFVVVGVCCFGRARPARAEYVELSWAKNGGRATLALLGLPAVVLDGYSIAYLKNGSELEFRNRLVLVLQCAESALLPAAGLFWYYTAGTGAEKPDVEVKVATATHVVLGLASLGLSIATVISHQAERAPSSASTLGSGHVSWLVTPTVLSTESSQGSGLVVAGRF